VSESIEVEINVPVCRCRVPESHADAVRARLEQAGLRVTAGPMAGGKRELDAKRAKPVSVKVIAARDGAVGRFDRWTPVAVEYFAASDTHAWAELIGGPVGARARRWVAQWRPTAPTWLPVFDVRTLTRTGAELLVIDDDDATRQLDVIAAALELPRDAITIKPRPGWRGYGHPTLSR
jgi:hypothetical protein